MQNDAGTIAEKKHKIDTSGSANVHGSNTAKENPGALAGATEANVEVTKAKPEYLDRLEAARNLQAAIDACDPAIAVLIMDQELDRLTFGQPSNTLYNAMEEAVWWADLATPAEHKAYCLASFNAMPCEDRAGFLRYVQGRAAA